LLERGDAAAIDAAMPSAHAGFSGDEHRQRAMSTDFLASARGRRRPARGQAAASTVRTQQRRPSRATVVQQRAMRVDRPRQDDGAEAERAAETFTMDRANAFAQRPRIAPERACISATMASATCWARGARSSPPGVKPRPLLRDRHAVAREVARIFSARFFGRGGRDSEGTRQERAHQRHVVHVVCVITRRGCPPPRMVHEFRPVTRATGPGNAPRWRRPRIADGDMPPEFPREPGERLRVVAAPKITSAVAAGRFEKDVPPFCPPPPETAARCGQGSKAHPRDTPSRSCPRGKNSRERLGPRVGGKLFHEDAHIVQPSTAPDEVFFGVVS